MGSKKQEEVGYLNEEEIVLFKAGFLKTLTEFQKHYLKRFVIDDIFFDSSTFFITYSFGGLEFSNYRYGEYDRNNKQTSDDNVYNFYESVIIAVHGCGFSHYLTILGIEERYLIITDKLSSLMESICKEHAVFQDLLDIYVSIQDTLSPELIEKEKQKYAEEYALKTISKGIDDILLRIKDTKFTIDDVIKMIQEKAILQMHEE
jgi:hypothetical protein